ncbi:MULTISPECIES: hypothetical protein [Pseudomonas fluorescens group]|uniref:Uncharacterized protein n=1 Tax=Pseudomonas fluorescens TaxID=294 RepID=A0A0D0TEK0_PSEFL|nr:MULTISPECIES: hypothetical protein [Pseudomonas fluorescens group]AZE60886.1 hypothetical protein C4K02_2524 [Pseudomonas synxantha]KIR19255.1 hypothetical protein PFLU3_50320 [Pseudomonas fluorescens]
MSLPIPPTNTTPLNTKPLDVQPHTVTKRDTVSANHDVERMTPREILQELKNDFGMYGNPYTGLITRDYLQKLADGIAEWGPPPTPRQMKIAQEVLRQTTFFDELDSKSKMDGIAYDDLAIELGDYNNLSDNGVIKLLIAHFDELGGGDTYVNLKELKQAAGRIPSDKTYSAGATAAASLLLDRPKLYAAVDKGIGFLGLFSGKVDDRFDMANLNYQEGKTSHQQARHRYPNLKLLAPGVAWEIW